MKKNQQQPEKYNEENYECPITSLYFFDPVKAITQDEKSCGHYFERDAIQKWVHEKTNPTCPCCRAIIKKILPTSMQFETALSDQIASQNAYNQVYFNLDHFSEIVAKNKLHTSIGQRYITLLKNAENHLNQIANEGTNKGKSAIEILCTTPQGRDLLRNKINILQSSNETQFLFHHAKITPDSLIISVNGKSILEWIKLKEKEIKTEAPTVEKKGALGRFFNLFSKSDQTEELVQKNLNIILTHIINGNRNAARTLLEKLKTENPEILKKILSTKSQSTTTDPTGKSFQKMTLLQSAIACNASASNENDQDTIEILSSYYDSSELKANLAKQIQEILPNGLDNHLAEQEKIENRFNFSYIVSAINKASIDEITQSLDNKNASLHETEEAKHKPYYQLSLSESLNRFREEFKNYSENETIYNPHVLCDAMQIYNIYYSKWDEEKRDLFVQQVIGFAQRFSPAYYAQIFCQGFDKVIDRNEPLSEDLTVAIEGNRRHPYYSTSTTGTGFEYMVLKKARIGAPKLTEIEGHLRTIISRKNKKLQRLIEKTLKKSTLSNKMI